MAPGSGLGRPGASAQVLHVPSVRSSPHRHVATCRYMSLHYSQPNSHLAYSRDASGVRYGFPCCCTCCIGYPASYRLTNSRLSLVVRAHVGLMTAQTTQFRSFIRCLRSHAKGCADFSCDRCEMDAAKASAPLWSSRTTSTSLLLRVC